MPKVSLVAILLGQAATTPAFDLGMLAQYGILGLLVMALIFGKVVPGYVVDQKDKRIEKLEAKVESYETAMQERVLPALIKSTDTLARLTQRNGN